MAATLLGLLLLGGGSWWAVAPIASPRRPRVVLRGEGTHLLPVAFLPDGRTLLAFDEHGGVSTWDVATGRLRRPLKPSALGRAVAFSPDGHLAAWPVPRGNGRGIPHLVAVVEVETGREVARLDVDRPVLLDLRFADDGTTFRVVGWDNQMRNPPAEPFRVFEWDAATWALRPSRRVAVPQSGGVVAVSPDLRHLATATAGRPGVTLWDAGSGAVLGVLDAGGTSAAGVASLAFCPRGDAVAVGTSDGLVETWDVATRSLRGVSRLFPGDASVSPLSFDPQGRFGHAVGYSVDASIVADLRALVHKVLPIPTERARSEVAVWETATSRVVARAPMSFIPALSPDGRLLAVSDGPTVTILELPELPRR